MRRAGPIALFAALLMTMGAACAADQHEGDVTLPTYRFADGASLPDVRLHYVTLGTPRRDASGAVTNAVLLLHGTTGTAQSMLTPRFRTDLYGPGKPLDAATHYLVIPDGIGTGGSSKPSDGLRARFPRYGYVDQVHLQHALLDKLGVAHPKLVLGTSMGGMQAWLWAEIYPDGADAFVPIAATPAPISGRNQVWRRMVVQAIRDDPDWKNGDYSADHPPRAWTHVMPLFSIMTTNADVIQTQAQTRAAADKLVDDLEVKAASRDANDLLYLFESSYDYDPGGRFDAITRPVFALNFGDDLLNPSDLLRMPQSPMVTSMVMPASAATFGHETLAHPELWGGALQTFLDRVPGWSASH